MPSLDLINRDMEDQKLHDQTAFVSHKVSGSIDDWTEPQEYMSGMMLTWISRTAGMVACKKDKIIGKVMAPTESKDKEINQIWEAPLWRLSHV